MHLISPLDRVLGSHKPVPGACDCLELLRMRKQVVELINDVALVSKDAILHIDKACRVENGRPLSEETCLGGWYFEMLPNYFVGYGATCRHD